MSHLKDPTTQYYTGEYPKQKQPTPGIQAKMTPVPDCGEKTYVGSGRLKDRKALVTGGDSGIGRAAAIAYAREGADVAISYLPVEEEDAQDVKKIIEECGRKAVLLPGDLSDEKFARSLVHEAQGVRRAGYYGAGRRNRLPFRILQTSPANSFKRPCH